MSIQIYIQMCIQMCTYIKNIILVKEENYFLNMNITIPRTTVRVYVNQSSKD